jgi:DUF917 family protein
VKFAAIELPGTFFLGHHRLARLAGYVKNFNREQHDEELMKISDAETVENLCWGLSFFGTGGGGRIEAGLDMLMPAVKAGRSLTLVGPHELADETWTCWAIIVGGRDPDEPPPAEELARYGLAHETFPTIVPRLVEAVRELNAHAGVKVGALVSLELSSAATAATILTGLELGIPTLDGDYVGRAIPELELTKMELLGKPPTPVVMVDRWGNKVRITDAVGAAIVDRLGRMVSRAAYGRGIATVGHLVRLRDARPALVRGSLLKAIEAGAALRIGAATAANDRLAPLRKVTGGHVLFTGETTAIDWRSMEPYAFRELDYHFRGTGEWAGSEFRIWVKNEHHAIWRDGAVIATSPDIISVLDPQTNRPLMTIGDVTVGQPVVAYAMRALDPVWHTPAGEALLGPRHFGLDFDAVPLSA